jgi:hypothetical protein
MPPRDDIKQFDFPLNGRLITKLDGALLPESHFQVLQNERYNDGGIEGVGGMTAVGVASLPANISNGFHFRKDFPITESHVFFQVDVSGLPSGIFKSDNTVDVPGVDTYSVFKTLTAGGNKAYFSEAPDESMMICDGYTNYVYSGAEYRCSKFINFNPDESFSYDYTNAANNNLTDAANRITLNRIATSGEDSNTKLLLHLDNNITDAIGTHTVTNFGWSNGSITKSDFVDGTEVATWTDNDGGTGASAYSAYDSRNTLKLDSGTPAGAGNFAQRTKDIGTIGSTFTVTLVAYFDALGTLAGGDSFNIMVDNGDIILEAQFATDGLYVVGAGVVEVGTNVVVQDIWQEYTFVVDATTPATATCKVYLDDVLIGTGVDCANAVSTTDGNCNLLQVGTASANRITYVDKFYVGAQDQVTFSTNKVFGTYSAAINASDLALNHMCLTVPDHADFDFSAGSFCIDTWFYADNLTAIQPIYFQGTSPDNYVYLYVSTTGTVNFVVYNTGVAVVSLVSPVAISAATWYHIEVDENGSNWYLFINGIQHAYSSDADRCANYTGVVKIGGTNSTLFASAQSKIDEFRVSKIYRHTANFSVATSAYNSLSSTHVYIGSTRPLSGVKFYTYTANTNPSSVTGYYWNGSAWTTVGTITDGTASPAGTTLGQTGVISFSSTVTTAKIKAINENIAYYYYFVFSDINANTVLSQVTLQAPVQALVDIWDGVPRQIYSFLYYTTVYADYTTNVYTLDFLSTDATTFVNVGGMTSSYYLYAGFNERLTGFKIYFGESNVNANTALLYVDYWNGTAWTSVGTLDDGTAVGGKTLNRSGVVTWNAPVSNLEFQTAVGNSPKWYYYRIRTSATLSATVDIDHIAGIPVQVDIKNYRYPVIWQNRLWMLNDQSREKNSGIGSSYGTVCVFNGTDSPKLLFGGSQEVLCGTPLFTRYGGSIYENLIVCKRNETYLVDGTSPNNYVVYKIAKQTGCIAPQTFIACDTGYEVAPGLTKHVVIWLSSAGVVMFDANSIINISSDIKDRFDKKSANYINVSVSDTFTAFYDPIYFEYHIMIATGSSTTLNEEWVYDLLRRKWWLANRGAKYLISGFPVEDPRGNNYVYAGTSDGYLERLENGTTFDGVSIVSKFRLPDGLLAKTLMYETEIRKIKVTGKVKSTTTANVIVRHYADGSTTATTTEFPSFSQNVSGKRFYQVSKSLSLKAITHSLEFEITTTNETSGFDPLYISGLYRVIRED